MISAVVTGNIGKEAELRDAGKDKVCSFSVASNSKVKGEKVTTWIRCSIWGSRGEKLAQYLTKGSRVAVAGELSTREHDGKTYIELRVNELDLMGGGEKKDRPASQSNGDSGGDSSDLPF
jgi:single-strand DNA-binding protein